MIDVVSGAGRIVLGASGSPGSLCALRYALVSRYCLSHARCPVLSIPHPATARELGLGGSSRAARRRDRTLDQVLRDWDAAA